MAKNLLILSLLTWMSFTYAKHPVAQESMGDAESYKLQTPVEEQEAQRSVAGAKIKKKKQVEGQELQKDPSKVDSEVRYWQYSE